MKKVTGIAGLMLSVSIACISCNNSRTQQLELNMEPKAATVNLPTANQWVNSPLRNRLKLKLKSKVENVWALVGDPANMPQYSEGLRKVETVFDDKGNCTGYTCFFKPLDGELQGIEHFAIIKWHEKHKGWASVDDNSNPFGTTQSLSLMTLQTERDHTIFTWDFHFNCANEESLILNKDSYQNALEDISQRLIKRFGGIQLENYVEIK